MEISYNNISGKLFSKAFSKKIKPILTHHGYKETSGAITDVGQLAENGVGVCVANMSCGYYAPHSDEEVVIFDDANNCLTMADRLIAELGNNKYAYNFTSNYSSFDFNWKSNDYNNSKWGDWSGANRNYWYGDYGTANKEVKINEETGEFECYYCGCAELLESDIGDDYAYCPDCISDIYVGENEVEVDPNQAKIDYNDYEDVSDNYDGSMEHRSLVNRYLTDHWSKTNK